MSSSRTETPLGDLLDVLIDHRGKTPNKLGGEFTDSGVPVVSAIHIKDGQIKWDERERYVSPQMFDAWMPVPLQKGDLLMTSEAPLGEVALVPSDAPLVLSQRLFALRGKPSVLDTAFLMYFFKSPEGQRRLQSRASGTTVQGIRQSELVRLAIPLPDYKEQKLIAEVLGAIDDLIAVNQNQLVSLDQLGMALFLKVWDRSRTARIDSLGEVIMGQSPPGSTLNEDKMGIVFFQGVRDFGSRYPSRRVFCVEPTRRAQEGDILIAVRAPVGDTNVATEETAIGRGIAALHAKRPATALRALRAADSTWAPYQGTGTVFSSITGPDLRGAQVPYVSDANLEALLATLDSQHLALSKENEQLTRVRDELLPLLLSGAITVKEIAA